MTPSKTLIPLAAFALASTLAAVPLQATVAVSNLDNPDQEHMRLWILGDAVSFTTGASPSTLQSVSAQILNGQPDGGTFSATIWSDAAGHADTPLKTSPSHFSNAKSEVLTFDESGLPLAPHTTYWVQLNTTATVAYWAETLLTSESSAYGWTIGDGAFGTTSPWGPYIHGDYYPIGRFSIDVTFVPEPSTLTACALSLPLLTRRRRRSH